MKSLKKDNIIQASIFTLVLLMLVSCDKKEKQEKQEEPDFLIEVGASKFMPMYFGSTWDYTEYNMLTGRTFTGREFRRYDSIPGQIFTYTDSQTLKSWAFWQRDASDLEVFRGPNNTVLFTTKYKDLSPDSIILLDSGPTFERVILGGTTLLDTKFGMIPCIVTMGYGKSSNHFLWKRYFGESIGVVMEDDYYIMSNGDTVEHYRKELDDFFIDRK